MVVTVFRSLLAPSFSRRVTGPLALAQVMVKGFPSVTLYALLVSSGSARTWETVAEMAKKRVVNFILAVM